MTRETEILRRLKQLRPVTDRARARLEGLQSEQRRLYAEGKKLGITAAAMARAQLPEDADPKSITYLAETIRQGYPERKKKARSAA